MSLSEDIVVILAGGEARRMGFKDKGELLIEGERLIDRLVRQVLMKEASVVLSASHDYGLGLPFVPDLEQGIKGPVGGIYAVLSWLKEQRANAKGFFSVPVDCPVLPEDLFKRLYDPNMSCVASDESRIHPVFAWWRLEDLEAIRDSLDIEASISLRGITKLTKARQVKWSGEDHFMNINTPEQLQKYQKL